MATLDERLLIRVSEEHRALFQAAGTQLGLGESEFVRMAAIQAAREELGLEPGDPVPGNIADF